MASMAVCCRVTEQKLHAFLSAQPYPAQQIRMWASRLPTCSNKSSAMTALLSLLSKR